MFDGVNIDISQCVMRRALSYFCGGMCMRTRRVDGDWCFFMLCYGAFPTFQAVVEEEEAAKRSGQFGEGAKVGIIGSIEAVKKVADKFDANLKTE